ncbi:hypothetical protein CcaverHIS002_0212090 [Cutaneotrichosporon cavernicola]|uniref:Phosphatidylinositol-specific phospholipase C X domain-containing protein n=1 Tax=Cutaneotrichosporon cavernicola TaxID=279322 RepID=A0AA48IG94_9TREE|nr:uncharacterized protein CcaverHIS019_0212100 [Cutaneotrichosporon cavernicola]BEI82049.1 hypothetical protein CcaverHIS002_0212090 [Cutaneotrichosporon cavernicola]BEI89848.1 hypothetical protein CcaverHIS019_0212100 [Cutaneotrichosporon cavernicola]BEI97618.1 hypothetical protein CcaverHIS631_0212070 [Cutaneotrichosporon cavernicola]BEJ05397.1 hypothetical protein CcaverHIS641_0212140 [Cutaneotrichosporon cavernicola]
MPIHVVTYGGIAVHGLTVNGGAHTLNINGNRVTIDAIDSDDVLMNVQRPGEGQGNVHVPTLPDHDRGRGWRRLGCAAPGVLAYGVDSDKVVILPRGGVDWMAVLPDGRALADLCIPGTHESAALSGGFISECQSVDIKQQLVDGVRFFDIRLKLVNGELKIYHGVQPQNSTLQQQVTWIEEFLRQHPRETVIASIKQENADEERFPEAVEEMLKRSGMWRFDEPLPTHGQCRGRAQFFSRFGKKHGEQFPNGQGIKPLRWPNSVQNGFVEQVHGIDFRVQDWYDTDNIPDKAAACIAHLEPTLSPRGLGSDSNHPYSLTFLSAGRLNSPPAYMASGTGAGAVSKTIAVTTSLFAANKRAGDEGGVNARVGAWLLQNAFQGRRPRATLMLDFYRDTGGPEGGMAELIASLNYINLNE